MKQCAIRLLMTAIIAGTPRSPAEGIQFVDKDERARLIAAKQAEDADDEVEGDTDDGDGLDKAKSKDLKAIATTEGASVEGNMDVVRQAIRDRRALFVDSSIEPTTDENLRKLASDRKVEVAENADPAAILAALKAAAKAD